MSDTLKKYQELLEDGHIFESPDRGNTIYRRTIGEGPLKRELIKGGDEGKEDEWLETFAKVARHYRDAPVSLLRTLTEDEFLIKKVCD
jgi:hypothetical protein